MEVVEALKTELEQVNGKLAALEQMKNDKAVLIAQAARLQKAIATLSGEPVVRKPMSEDAKARIKAGLEKARAAKAASAAGQAQLATQPTSSTEPVTGTKKSPAADKGSGRGAN